MLVLALASLTLHHSIRLHVYHCFHCVETDNVHKTHFQREITRFSAFNVVFAENSRLNAGNCFLALVSLFWHNSMRLHVSFSFHYVKTDNMPKTPF